jgi:hypothetical protein
MHLPFIGRTQEANMTGLIDHKEVFERVAFLFAALILLLFLRILWPLDGAFSLIMKKRGT